MNDIELIHDGHPIGQFISGPDHEMVIHYMPYRSLTHYVFCHLLENKEIVTIQLVKRHSRNKISQNTLLTCFKSRLFLTIKFRGRTQAEQGLLTSEQNIHII